jgi:hypothetical protein
MPRTKKNEKIIEEIFQPDEETGISEWKSREFIQTNHRELKFQDNGNIRHGICFGVDKYKWEIKRLNDKPRGKVLKFRTLGFSKNKLDGRPIRKEIRDKLLIDFKNCRHCGNHKDLCIDHKNDMYNDKRVLDKTTQTKDDFQVLCNKCNKDIKHPANEKEKKEGKIHSVKDLNLSPFKLDNFEYPWEKGIRIYDEKDRNCNCKMYSYWYDVDEFHRKRNIFVLFTRTINNNILRKVKLIP